MTPRPSANGAVPGIVGSLMTVGAFLAAAATISFPEGPTTPAPATAHSGAAAPQSFQDINAPYDGQFHFARIYFESRGGRGGFGRGRGGGALWAHDYPRADYNFLSILTETTFVRSHDRASNVIPLDDPDLFRYPIAYIVEIGSWVPTDEEVGALGEYLLKGGFLIVDDFQGYRALQNLQLHLGRAVPGAQVQLVEPTDDIFDSFFRIIPDNVIPPYGGQPPLWLGVYEDNDPTKRLMVMINANNDIAEYWEFSDQGYYPIDLSNEAYKLGVNYVVYGLTH
ncbi:MAG: DUF4159 domain-containing protein [Gemmatimonadetes bacterium]|nr:DUF4159 domain-containing protein [Gemmatimonadota bacterium]